MNPDSNELILPFIAFVIVVLFFLLFIAYSFEDKPLRSCIFPTEFDCIAYQVSNETTNTISLQIINNLGEEVNLTRANIPNSACSYSITPIINGTKRWPANGVMWFSFDCKELETEEGMVTINIQVLSYLDDQDLRYTGRIRYSDN